MKRILAALLPCAALIGCGGSTTEAPNTLTGSFSMIEGAVDDISSTIMDPSYKGTRSRDLGTDSDRIGMALLVLQKQAEGTSLVSDIEQIKSKVVELEELASSRAPIDKQREALKVLKETVAAAKAKL